MTTREKLQAKGITLNLNTVLLCFSLIGGCITAIRFGGPILSMPDRQAKVETSMNEMQRKQDLQTEAIKTLADIQRDQSSMRRDVDRNMQKLEDIARRLDRIESR